MRIEIVFAVLALFLCSTSLHALTLNAGMTRFFGSPKDFHNTAQSITNASAKTINDFGDANGIYHHTDFYEGLNYTGKIVCLLPREAENDVLAVIEVTRTSSAGNAYETPPLTLVGHHVAVAFRDDNINGDQVSSTILDVDLVFNSCATFIADNDLSGLTYGAADRYLGQIRIKN